eukprot:scaffold4036_cov17-Tisochrysis_lutea.AAC.1
MQSHQLVLHHLSTLYLTLGTLKCPCLNVHGRALSVYNPRLEKILNIRRGLVAMVVVVAFILSGKSTAESGTKDEQKE